MKLPELALRPITSIELDGAIRIRFGEHKDTTLRIEVPFTIVERGTNFSVCFLPATKKAVTGMDALAMLFRAIVTEASAEENGRLSLIFAEGQSLNVEPSADYEAWSLTGPEGTLVSLPGGGLG
jgi:hypothetical protein